MCRAARQRPTREAISEKCLSMPSTEPLSIPGQQPDLATASVRRSVDPNIAILHADPQVSPLAINETKAGQVCTVRPAVVWWYDVFSDDR